MAQKAALEVIRYIEDFWGQPLTRRLADRIADRDLSDEVFDFYANWPPLRELPDLTDDIPRLEPGQVRPVVGSIIHPYTEMATAPLLLLYVESILMDDARITSGWSFHREDIRRNLGWLADMKPLVLDGSIYFFSKSHLRWSSVQDVTTRLTESRRDAWKGTRLRKLKGEQRRAEIELVLNDIVGNIPPLRNRTGSPIALNTVEERAYQLALNGVQTSGGRAAALARLGQWGLPKFKSSPSSLVRLRGSDLFQQWRLTLALALNAAGDVPDDRDGAKQARAILTGELEAASARVRKEANSSLALGGIKFGWKGFAIGALTSAPSGLMEADPVAGTALAGAMGAAGGLIEGYVTAAHLRAESRAVWDIVSSFRDLDRDGV